MKNRIKWLYKWHRRLGVLAAVPILGWCFSGMTHPLMANFYRLKPVHRMAPVAQVHLDSNSLPLSTALQQNNCIAFEQMRWVVVEGEPYYQILKQNSTPLYLHAHTGIRLENGDKRYAQQLARHFLADSSSSIVSVEPVQQFTARYKFINRLLPVYRVLFDRADGMAVYVHTQSSRLGTLNDHHRRRFMWVFSQLHNWDFVQGYPRLRLGLMLFWLLAGGFVALSGLCLYGVWWRHWRGSKLAASASRRWHRRIGLLVSLSSLAFVFSGGYHALAKQEGKGELRRAIARPTFALETVHRLPDLWATFNKRAVHQISLAEVEGRPYFQVDWDDPLVETSYFDVNTLEVISQGEERYALTLAKRHTQLADAAVDSVRLRTRFGGEYGFINKRLPVHGIYYDTDQQHSVYVETSTGKLAAVITSAKRREALSFLLLHKYHWLDPLGKPIRDSVIVLLLLGITVVHILGLILWWRTRAVT